MRAAVEGREIERLIHFTRFENLNNILQHGIRPRQLLDASGEEYIFNDDLRLDGCLDAVSLSISFPNYKMFYPYRCQDYSKMWAVLRLSPSILWEKDCAFCWQNAASAAVTCVPLCERRGRNAFLELFANKDGFPRRENTQIPNHYPTHPQAEVLCFDTIEPQYIERVDIQTRFNPNQLFAQIATNVPGRAYWYDDELFNGRFDYRHWPSNAEQL
jgi:hypothetical protein